MTLHHWFQVRAWDWKGIHCKLCPCKNGYADVGRPNDPPAIAGEKIHRYCEWVDDLQLEKKEALRFLRQQLLQEDIP